MLDFIWSLPVQLWGTRNKWTLQKILIHGRIRTTNSGTFCFPACTSNPSATETVWTNQTLWTWTYTYMCVHWIVKTWPNREWVETEIHIRAYFSFKGQYILMEWAIVVWNIKIIIHNAYWKSSALDQSASRSLTAVSDFNFLYYPALTHIQVYMYITVGYI